MRHLFPLLNAFGCCCLGLLLSSANTKLAATDLIQLNGHQFTVADGYTIELAADSELSPRPITGSFDQEGALYVADSSGSNAPVQQQLEERTHRILRLTDTDGDGRFDQRTVFADRMMFPEGTLWFKGSLYVAAPPQIWKLTDTDQDGVADQREVWFDGKTLTGCANDLHGPYLGRDGWIYWCKGAFAEQTYTRHDGSQWTTRASHVFRRHPEGGVVEPVMAGGMDNPVDVVITPGGERIFTTTFLTHPGNGQRDGLIHAVYGGVYGKDHGVIEGHPRTGELLPPLTHLGAAAPSGLELVEGPQASSATGNLLLTCSFNLHKVFLHALSESGSTFSAPATDLVASDQLDFHPTDVVQAPDGSWLIIDTGGWYKLCCPTSQLVKPDVLGAIYRVKRVDAQPPSDPLGKQLAWETARVEDLIERFDDPRLFVRQRAIETVAERGGAAVGALHQSLARHESNRVRLNAVWCLSWIADPAAREAARVGLSDAQPVIKQATLHTIALHRDQETVEQICERLGDWDAATQRVACEALGRIGSAHEVSSLMRLAASGPLDTMLQHSLTFALIEIGDPEHLQVYLGDGEPLVRRCAAIALDQLGQGATIRTDVLGWLNQDEPVLAETARWLLRQHPDWAPALAKRLPTWLDELAADPRRLPSARQWLGPQLQHPTASAAVADWMSRNAQQGGWRLATLTPLDLAAPGDVHPSLTGVLLTALGSDNLEVREKILDWLAQSSDGVTADETMRSELDRLVADTGQDLDLRLGAAKARFQADSPLPEPVYAEVKRRLESEQDSTRRQTALRLLNQWPLDDTRRRDVVELLGDLPATEMASLLNCMRGGNDDLTGLRMVELLQRRAAYRWIPESQLREVLESYGEKVSAASQALWDDLALSRQEQSAQLTRLMDELPEGDLRRGQKLFHEQRTQCIRCHQMGYLGGKLGPDLTRIGGIRQEKDLLEAIVFPSISFVRSYEPMLVTTTDGQQIQGLVVEQSGDSITIATQVDQSVRIRRDDIEEMNPGSVSLMPSGFDQQLTPQELADLVEFLKASR